MRVPERFDNLAHFSSQILFRGKRTGPLFGHFSSCLQIHWGSPESLFPTIVPLVVIGSPCIAPAGHSDSPCRGKGACIWRWSRHNWRAAGHAAGCIQRAPLRRLGGGGSSRIPGLRMGSPAWRQRRTSDLTGLSSSKTNNVCIKQMLQRRSDLTRWRPLWRWWSGTRLARRRAPRSDTPPHTTGPPARPRGAVRWAVATMGSRWRWRPRRGGWSLVVGRKARRGSLTTLRMNLQEEKVLQESKSPTWCKEKSTQNSDILTSSPKSNF